MAIFDIPKLQRYRALGYNVLMSGHAGVGKTAVIHTVFDGLKSLYFSAPTMDPWVDLVGVPRAVSDEKRGGQVLELVRPEFVKAGEVEAIFIDELNRAPDKVLNALMELIQFKSINGFKLPNLKIIWAAINPHDDSGEYAVNKLDRALTDRFQVQLTIPYDVDEEFFVTKYPDIGAAFVSWWRDLDEVQKAVCSPRRLEYACDAYLAGCHLADFLPEGLNISKLKQGIKALPFADQMAAIKTDAEAEKWLKDVNKATKLLQLASNKDPQALAFYERHKRVMPQELVEALTQHVVAADSGRPSSTLREVLSLIDKAKLRIGDKAITHQVNKPVFAYTNGKTLEDEVKALMAGGGGQMKLLAAHMTTVMTKAPKATLKEAMLDDKGARTNFVTIAMFIASNDKTFEYFTKDDRKKINAHTYVNDCAASKWM